MGQNSQCKGLKPISSGQEPGMDDQMEHEKAPADAPALGNHGNARQDEEARPQACGETSQNSFVHETHAVAQPLGPEDVFASLIYEIKSASGTAFREAWQVTVEFLFAEVYTSIPAQRERLSPTKARYPKMKQAERKLLTAFFEEACVKITCTYQQWVQYATSLSKDILNTTWMLTTIVE